MERKNLKGENSFTLPAVDKGPARGYEKPDNSDSVSAYVPENINE